MGAQGLAFADPELQVSIFMQLHLIALLRICCFVSRPYHFEGFTFVVLLAANILLARKFEVQCKVVFNLVDHFASSFS